MTETVTERDLTVYLLLRTDLPSMNPGKGAAQSHHAGVQMIGKFYNYPMVQQYLQDGVANGANWFNTTLTMGATKTQIDNIFSYLTEDMAADRVIDPEYPFFVSSELTPLIPQTATTKMIKSMGDGTDLWVRPELTCAWVLGDRKDPRFTELFKGLKLHP